MFDFLKRDRFADHLVNTGQLRPQDRDIISDPTFYGERQFIPNMEAPAVYPESALIFLAQGAVRLASEGYPDEIGWPFEGTPQEYLDSVGIEPFRPS